MKLPFLAPRPSIPAPKPSVKPAPVATPTPSAPAPRPSVFSSFKHAVAEKASGALSAVGGVVGAGVAAAKSLLSGGAEPLATTERKLAKGASADGSAALATLRAAARQKLMGPYEKVAVQQLPPQQRADYVAVANELKSSTDPVARLSLQTMLLENKLDADTLHGLRGVLTQPLAAGIDRHALLADLTNELADPANIRQGAHDTCGAVGTAQLLATESPAAYVRMVAGLASPAGTARLPGGAVIERGQVSGFDDRSTVQQLVAPALMAEAAPPGITYDGRRGYFVNTHGEPVNDRGEVTTAEHAQRKLPEEWATRLLDGALSGKVETYDVGAQAAGNEQEVATDLVASASERGAVPVTLDGDAVGADGLHRVTVLGMSEDGQRVRYMDPRGGGEREMSRATFERALRRFSSDLLTPDERRRWNDRDNGGFFTNMLEHVQEFAEGVTGADDEGGRTTRPGGGTNG